MLIYYLKNVPYFNNIQKKDTLFKVYLLNQTCKENTLLRVSREC